MRRCSWDAVNTLDFQTEKIHRLYALINYHWYWRAVSVKKVFKRDTENGVDGGLRMIIQYPTCLLCCCLTNRSAGILGLGKRVG